MNLFYTFSSILWAMAFGYNSLKDPLIMVYYPEEEVYGLSDLATLQHATSPRYSKIILFCPIATWHFEDLHDIVEIKSANAEGAEDWNYSCDGDVIMKTMTIENSYFRKGFYVLLNDYVLSRNELLANIHSSNIFFSQNQHLAWVDIYWLYFDFENAKVSVTCHRITAYEKPKNNRALLQCVSETDTIDGLQEYLDKCFDKKNQDKILSRFNLTVNVSEPKIEYFVKHKLIPTDDFTDMRSRLATCWSLNFVPLWESISNGPMKQVEEYIQRIAQELPMDTLGIMTVPMDDLKLLPKNTNHTPIIARENVYLDSDQKKIPVPKIVLKIITYRVPLTSNENGQKTPYPPQNDDYHIVVVVHNEINTNIKRLCGHENIWMCKRNGWPFGVSTSIYCCDLRENYFKDNLEVNIAPRKIFDLHKVRIEKEGSDPSVGLKNVAGIVTQEDLQ